MNSVALQRGPLAVGSGAGRRSSVSEIRERAAARNREREAARNRERATPNNGFQRLALERPANGSALNLLGLTTRRSSIASFQSSVQDNDIQHGGMDVERGPLQEEDPQRDEDGGIKSEKVNTSTKITENSSVPSSDSMEEKVHESKNADSKCRHNALDDLTAVSEAEIATESKEIIGQKLEQEHGGTPDHIIDHTESLSTSKIGNMRSEMQGESDSVEKVATLHEKNRLLSDVELLNKCVSVEVEAQTLRRRTSLLRKENDELKLLLNAKQDNE